MDKQILNIITRILANEANPSDILTLNERIGQDAKNKFKFRQLMEYWNIPVEIENAESSELSFERFKTRIEREDNRKNKFRIWAYPIAAAVALLFISTFFIHLFLKDHLSIEYYTYACQNGNYHLVLPDNTSVFLSKDSKITYTDKYGKNGRNVTLQGEAFFNVEKSGKVFKVDIAGSDAVVEVLGTEFNLKSYENEDEIILTLESGSVIFKDSKQQMILSPNQQLSYNKNSSGFNMQTVDTELFTSWKDNIYRHYNISLQELCNELEKMFGVEIGLNPQLKDIKVSCSFKYEQDLDEILDIMNKSVPFKWSKNGTKYTIK